MIQIIILKSCCQRFAGHFSQTCFQEKSNPRAPIFDDLVLAGKSSRFAEVFSALINPSSSITRGYIAFISHHSIVLLATQVSTLLGPANHLRNIRLPTDLCEAPFSRAQQWSWDVFLVGANDAQQGKRNNT